MQAPTPTVRSAGADDIPALVDFNRRMAMETEDKQLDADILTSGVGAVLDDPRRGFYLIAEVDGQIAGALMVTTEWSDWRDGDFWWVQSVYVKHEFRRRGVFRALYQETRQLAKDTPRVRGCRLYVDRHNATAQATYAKLGLVETDYKMLEEVFP